MLLVNCHILWLNLLLDILLKNIWLDSPALLVVDIWVKVVIAKYLKEEIIYHHQRHLLTLSQELWWLIVLNHILNLISNKAWWQLVIWVKIHLHCELSDELWVTNGASLRILKEPLEQWLITAHGY